MAPQAKLKQPKKPKLPTSKENVIANADHPNWPRFNPLLPRVDLSLRTLVEDQLVLIPNFWTATLCRTYVSFLSTLPLVTTTGKLKKGDALRVNDRFEINDPDFAERLWSLTALKDLVLNNRSSGNADSTLEEESMELWGGVVVGLNPRIRIYRYRKGQFFDQHCRSIV